MSNPTTNSGAGRLGSRNAKSEGVLMMRVVLFIAMALAPWCTAIAGFKVVNPPAKPAAAAAPSAAMIASAQPAKAGFQPLDGGDATGQWGPTSGAFGTSSLTYTGTPPSDVEVRRGMGKGVRLADALKQIAPDGWRGFGRPEIAGTFNPNKTVDWVGGKPWTVVLDGLARAQGLSVEVDWNRKHLYVGKRLPSAAAPTTLAATQQPAATAAPAAPLWEAKVGSTVRSTMEDWSKRAGWMLVWPMGDLDYRVIAPLRFNGSIVDATSNLARLYESAERPLAVDIHVTQKVIVFSEKGAAAP